MRRGDQFLRAGHPRRLTDREGNVTGKLNAPLPAFAVPLPSMIGPDQSTVNVLENVAMRVLA